MLAFEVHWHWRRPQDDSPGQLHSQVVFHTLCHYSKKGFKLCCLHPTSSFAQHLQHNPLLLSPSS